jgi:hypothetical protein
MAFTMVHVPASCSFPASAALKHFPGNPLGVKDLLIDSMTNSKSSHS